MATMKKPVARKAAPKKIMKRPVKQQAPQQAPPAPIQQAPQPPMGAPAPGSNGPMMRRGGKIKKAENGATTTAETTKKPTGGFKKTPQDIKDEKANKGRAVGVVISKEDEKKHPEDFKYITRKNGGSMKKAKSGGKFPDLNKDGKITKADVLIGKGVIKGKKTTPKKAQGGTKLGKALPPPATMKSGGKMKTCKGGC